MRFRNSIYHDMKISDLVYSTYRTRKWLRYPHTSGGSWSTYEELIVCGRLGRAILRKGLDDFNGFLELRFGHGGRMKLGGDRKFD